MYKQGNAAVYVLLAAAVVSLVIALLPPYATDMVQIKHWTRTVTLEGLHNVYNGTWPYTYSIYPPITLATDWVVGQLYLLLGDPSFSLTAALESPLLSYLLKLPGIGFHLLTGLVLFRLARSVRSHRAALTCAALYLFNPAALFDLAYWGQPDSVYAFFLVLSVAGVATGPAGLGWGALAAAALAKPQAWSLGPLLVAAGTWSSLGTWVRELGATMAVTAVVLVPFIVGDRLPQLATLPAQIGSVAPALSANAHNLWWLVSGGQGLHLLDTTPLASTAVLVTPRRIGYLLWGMATLLALLALRRSRQRFAVYEAAAFVAFAFVMVATRIHENHAFMVLPLGVIAAVHRPALWKLWTGISVVLLVNLSLHDPAITRWIGAESEPGWWRGLTLANAAAAAALLLAWTARLLTQIRKPAPDR